MITSDIEILEFIYARMVKTHKENPYFDYMIRFKKIIKKQKDEQFKSKL